MRKIFLPLLLAAGVAAGSMMARQEAAPSLKQLARLAVSPDESESTPAIETLRARGTEGLQALLQEHGETIKHRANRGNEGDVESWERLSAALDAVSQQKDCHASQLFWFTDFEQAKAAAAETGKPILSLRLLGKLNEEYSCANSRFFRTTLYSNPEVSKHLREHFVLHWKSVRPVPRVTIDFGDGRKIERTITGNSIHYVLAPDGTPIDALPGLYSAKTFLTGLAHAQQAVAKRGLLPAEEQKQFLRNYHLQRLDAVQQEYLVEVAKLKETQTLLPIAPVSQGEQPNAKRAAVMAFSKSEEEIPLIESTFASEFMLQNPIEQQMSDPVWSRIAALHEAESKLDTNSLQLIRSKNPTATAASRLALTKSIAEDPLVRVVANLERSIAEDTVRNEYVLHRQIHNWFTKGLVPGDVDQLNRKVYAELFLTPDSDPWLGLVPTGSFSGLQNDGLNHARK